MLYLIITVLVVWCNFTIPHYISWQFNKGITIKNRLLKKLLWIKEELDYIAYISIVFIIIDYLYLVATTTCFIICFFIHISIANKIIEIMLFVGMGLFVLELIFTFPDGIKGS